MSEMLMPKLSDTMEEGTVLRWLKADGDSISRGEPLVEIETDKATMTVEAPADGTLSIIAAEGDTLDVGAPIAEIGGAGATPAAPAAGAAPEATDPGATGVIEMPDAPTQEIEPVREGGEPPADHSLATGIPTADDGTAASIASAFTPADVQAPDDQVAASPLARTIAAREAIDLASITGTGPGGRIVKADVEAMLGSPAAAPAAPSAAPAPPPAPSAVPMGDWPAGRRTPLTRLQRTISRRMDDAVSIPEFTLERDVDTTALAAARADLRVALPEGNRPSVNDFVVRAVAMAVRERPDMASRREGDDLVVPDGVDVGVAVAVPNGLIVPVIHGADGKGVPQIAGEVRDLATRGRAGDLRPDELEGSVISVTNLGMFGVDRFHAVINPGEAAILAVGRAVPRPTVVDGHVVVREVMTLSLSVDHRVAYGAEAATFLGRVAELLEHPAALLV
jgi:pyruvate dehydrogenase E2 component (dihydrolipoamide acetyltransferase)